MNTYEKLIHWAEFLKNLPEEKFDMKNWVSDEDMENVCGTVCCAAGWLPAAFPNEPELKDCFSIGLLGGHTQFLNFDSGKAEDFMGLAEEHENDCDCEGDSSSCPQPSEFDYITQPNSYAVYSINGITKDMVIKRILKVAARYKDRP